MTDLPVKPSNDDEPGPTGVPFEEDEPARTDGASDALVVSLEGYEGPLDVLLALARNQKLDLKNISILDLADQYLAFIAELRSMRLEIAADYLVMAAWLAYLKSRLLLPEAEEAERPSGEELAARLAFRLQRLEAMREASARLMSRPRLGRDIFPRGEPEGVTVLKRSAYVLTVYELLKAYAQHTARKSVAASFEMWTDPEIFSVEAALERLRRLVGELPDWAELQALLPDGILSDPGYRSAVASMLTATLELTRQGGVELRQTETFGPLFIRRRSVGK